MSDQPPTPEPHEPAPHQPPPAPGGSTSHQPPAAPQPTPQPDRSGWVQVPPHPPAAPQTAPLGAKQGGKALPIASMALGLIGLFSSVVFGFYFNLFVFATPFIGVVAVVLGIIALVKRGRPRAASITGVVTGAISIIVALVLGVLGVVALTANLFGGIPGENQGEERGEGSDSGEGWADAQPESLIEWPSNMASGGIVFAGPGDPRPAPSAPLQPGMSPSPHEIDRGQGNDVLIYVDYRCPHCMMFEHTNGALLNAAVESGNTTVEIVALSFLDRASDGAYYSSRAAGAMACMADAQPEGAWRAHEALLSPEVQPSAGPGLTNTELVSVLDGAVGGLNSDARGCIEGERFVSFAQALNNWVSANPVPNANVQGSRISGTPSVFVNGAFYVGATDDAAEFEAFFEGQTR